VLGFEMRAAGLNLVAARLAGLRTTGALLRALAISGALAGLAGGIEVSAITYRLYDNFSPGYGFTAIAVALLGRLHPLGVVVAALLFGALDVGSTAMQSVAGVSSVLVSAIQAIVILALLALYQPRGTTSPHECRSAHRADGIDVTMAVPRSPPPASSSRAPAC
jgi:simple sugar transport system permease protein